MDFEDRGAQRDHPGFWEQRGYSNTAYPWREVKAHGAQRIIDMSRERFRGPAQSAIQSRPAVHSTRSTPSARVAKAMPLRYDLQRWLSLLATMPLRSRCEVSITLVTAVLQGARERVRRAAASTHLSSRGAKWIVLKILIKM